MVFVGIGVLVIGAAWQSRFVERMLENRRCCHLDFLTSLRLAFAETVAPSEYASEVGQDKWVLERVFPETERGFFVEVGSGHGYIGSNSLALERRGWTGICVESVPHADGRAHLRDLRRGGLQRDRPAPAVSPGGRSRRRR